VETPTGIDARNVRVVYLGCQVATGACGFNSKEFRSPNLVVVNGAANCARLPNLRARTWEGTLRGKPAPAQPANSEIKGGTFL
jgi:hypothetical protein